MATNKNAQIRYQALDRCLSNWSRRYYIDDLVDACNEALYNYNGEGNKGDGVKKRQVQEDLKLMESEEGYRMMIDAIRDGHKMYYRYHERNDSIRNRPFNQEELNIVSDALMLLKRFEGVPQFDWLKDVDKQLYSTSQLGKDVRSV
ncbi:MAG: WYL domain-containing protein, partial [Prevotella sp.]|nr:WYL domain-containing protein [Prevotella sp.]